MAAPSRHVPGPPETPLLDVIRQRIAAEGPISVADYMDLALNHPEHGYYRTRNPFGIAGDFVTAPESSQVFGELIGLWFATAWTEAGQPSPFRLIELGPGRGQLMADLLRATASVPGFEEAADIHLVETSEHLRNLQRDMLKGQTITWHEQLDEVPAGPVFLIANEFFDALPAHQLVRREIGWTERKIATNGDHLAFVEGEAPAMLAQRLSGLQATDPDQIAELSPAREELARSIGARIQRDGGVAIIIDYGAWVDRATGDTLQAVRHHRPADPLDTPGEVDLTTQVDFRRTGLAAIDGGADVFGPVPQGTFLRALGIEVRTAALLKRADQEQQRRLREALYRLTDASAMGEAFKVMALAAPDGPPPPGFSTPTLQAKTPQR